MPPTGGYRTSMAWQVRYGPLGEAVSNAVFSPGQPLAPPDPQPVRLWDFPVGVNTTITPRPQAPFGFAHLRAFSNVELVRLAIETRKDQLEALHWRFNPRPSVGRAFDIDARAQRLTQFWRRPDGAHGFAAWLRLAIEDLLAIDAPAFEKRRDRAGRLIGLDPVPGDTLKLLVDETGRTPLPPEPAYQQIIKGRVWADLTTDDLLYAPRNRRPNHVMGFSPVEQIVVTIQTIINRQAAQLAYFTEIPRYVSVATDTRYLLPAGFVRLHDAAVLGVSPDAASSAEPDDAPSGVKVSAATAVIVANYGDCRADQQRLSDLQDWARKVGLTN